MSILMKYIVGSLAGTVEGSPPPPEVSNAKNLRITPFSAIQARYEAFGNPILYDNDFALFAYRDAVNHTNSGAVGLNGVAVVRPYQISTDEWKDKVIVDTEPNRDISDTYIGKMTNGEIVVFSSISPVYTTGPMTVIEPAKIFYRKGASHTTLGPRQYLTDGVGGYDEISTGSFFAGMTASERPGEYFIGLWQADLVTGRSINACVRTQDSWATYEVFPIYDLIHSRSETTIQYLGAGKLLALTRIDEGGVMLCAYSSDYGETWTPRGQTNIGYYGFEERNCWIEKRNNLYDIFVTDRDAGFILASYQNNPATFFDTATNFNPLELYADMRGASTTFNGLGYFGTCPIVPDLGVYLCTFAKEEASNNADLWYTRHNFSSDPLGTPTAPPSFSTVFLGTTAFRLQVEGYTAAQWANIRYFELQVSLNASFSSFITASYQHVQPGVVINNIRIPAPWFHLTELSPGTTYYIRLRAKNNTGTSAYTTTSITTTGTTGYTTNVTIPYTNDQYYQNNIDTIEHPTMLNDGVTSGESSAKPSYLANYTFLRGQDRNHKIVRRFPKEWDVIPKKIRWYKKSGGTNPTAPTYIYIVPRSTGVPVAIGNYTASPMDTWVEFDVLVSDQVVCDMVYYEGTNQHGGNGHFGTGYCWASEIEVFGDYKNAPAPSFSRPKFPLSQLFGANSFWWNLNQSNDGGSSNVVNTDRVNRHVQMGLTSLRPYITWRHVEASAGTYTWNPTTHGWYTDLFFNTCDTYGLGGHFLIMGLPPYLYTTWEGSPYISPPYNGFSHPAQYFTPVTYANRDNRELPSSYDPSAKLGYQIASHYGAPGLGTVTSIEIGNERDATWLGKYGHSDGRILAAETSAWYDGHKNTMGAGRGVKNADSSIKVVMCGLAISKTDLFKGFIDWCIENRGYSSPGVIDLPFDVINYHEYSTDGATQFSPTTTAMPPELSRALPTIKEYIDISNRYCNGKEVWVTEWGYDVHPQSTFAPPAVGTYSIAEVAGCWGIRTILHQFKEGISGSYWFQTFANSVDGSSPAQFDTCKLLEFDAGAGNTNKYSRTPMGDYLMQLKTYGAYQFDATISTNPYVIRLKHPTTNKLVYIIWQVESSFPTTANKWVLNVGYSNVSTVGFTENTGFYNLSLPGVTSINIRHFKTGASDLTLQTVTVSGGAHNVPYGMFPTIVSVDTSEPTPNECPTVIAGSDQSISFGATLNLSGSASDPDGTILYSRWSKVAGPSERGRSTSTNTFNTGTKNFQLPQNMYFTSGMSIRVYATFSGYLTGTVTTYSPITGAMVYEATGYNLGDATLNQSYSLWDAGVASVITSPSSLSTTVTGLVPGSYVFKLMAEDNDFATGEDTLSVNVT